MMFKYWHNVLDPSSLRFDKFVEETSRLFQLYFARPFSRFCFPPNKFALHIEITLMEISSHVHARRVNLIILGPLNR